MAFAKCTTAAIESRSWRNCESEHRPFTAAGWPGTFYPEGLPEREYLTYYASKFDTVEVDSTFYRTPALTTVKGLVFQDAKRLPICGESSAENYSREDACRL